MINQAVFGRTRVITFSAALLALAIGLAFALASDTALAQSNAPATPSSVALTRADGTVTASWPAVSGATKYHVTYSSDNKASWTAAASPGDNHSANSITITAADNGKSYVVGVRAGNDGGQWSGWRNSPSVGPYTPPDPTPTPTPTPAPAPPAAPASVTVTRADGTVTASWNAPDGATKYHVTYSSDNKQSWTAASDNHTGNSITITGADNSKTYIVGVRAGNAGGWSGWRNSDAIPPLPSAPANLAVTPGEGYLDVAWDSVSGATGYDVRAKTAGAADWHRVASNVTGTSHRYTTDATIDYIAVRAVNAGGPGPWAEISRLPAHGWLTSMQQSGGASAQSANAQSQLTAPTWGTITRDNGTRADGYDQSITVNWTAVTGATGYYVVCSDSGGWSWWDCGGTIRFNEPRTVTIDNDASGEDLGRYRSYTIGVRAVNDNPNDASNWTDSANIRPVIGNLRSLTSTRGNGSITLSWTPTAWTTGYLIDCAEADMTPPYTASVYTRCATLTGQLDTATSHSVTIPHSTNSTYTIDNTKTYDIKIISTNQWGQSDGWLVPLVAPLSVGAAEVAQTTAKLKVANYTGAWWYKRTVPTGDNTCHSIAAGTTEASLSSLTAGVAYTYKTYDKTGCGSADEIATVNFFTGSSVSNLSETSDGTGITIHDTSHAATQFTTGDAAAGYTLDTVTVDIKTARNTAGNLTVAIHAVSGGNPAPTATYTLSGANPTAAGQHTFTCPTNATCSLVKERSYFVVLSQSGGGSGGIDGYDWDTTASTAQTNAPTGFGWSIADTGFWYYSNNWNAQTGWTGMFKVSARANPALAASDATSSSATLTIANHSGTWHYKATSGPHTTCQGPVSGASATLIGLTKGATYTYSAYRDSGCATLLATAAAFTTPTITVAGIGDTTATLIITNYGGANWWYKADSGPYTSCQGPYIDRSQVNQSGLTEGTPYTITAYSKTGCASDDLVTNVYFTTTTTTLTASNFADTTATLTIGGHTGNWYYKANAAPDNTCQGPVSNSTSKNLTGLTSGTSYIYKAYSDSTCTSANLLATAASFSVGSSHATNLHSVKTGQTIIGNKQRAAVAFTTGASANGYTLTSITAPLRQIDTGASLTVTLHQMSGAGSYSTSSTPSSTILATLSGTDPSSTAWADTTYTCSGSGCSLSANTTYFIVALSSRDDGHAWAAATTESESTYPSNSGWSIGYGHDKESDDALRPWYSAGDYHPVRVDFTTNPAPTLASSNVTATGATLTIANHTGGWYYKYTSPSGGTCSTNAVSGTSTTVTLSASTSYTFAAYSDSSCSSLLATAASFTTPAAPTLTSSNVTASGATLTIANHTGGWWYKGGKLSGTDGACTSVASGTSTATLSGLEADTQYEYKAYDKANCASADRIATARFATRASGSGPTFSVTNVTSSAATLTLHNRTGNWWYKGGNRSGGEGNCTAGPSNFVLSLSALEATTEYTYRAYSDSSCGTQIATATFRTQN